MTRCTTLTISASILLSLATCAQAAQISLNMNSIVNPGAEDGQGSVSGNDIYPVPGWTTTGNFTAVQYGSTAAPLTSPGPEFGANFFSGGPNNPTNQATQFLDVSNIAPLVDLGKISFVLSGYFGGYLAQNDNATLFATFFDTSSATIANSAVIGGFNSTSRNNISQLLYDATTGFIPAGTRSIEFTLVMTRTEGFYNDGYADNLAFVATSTPEPASWGMAALGIAALLVLRSHRAARA